MRHNAIFRWLGALILAFGLIPYSTSSIASGTEAERAACTPDVFRLCSSEIPSETKIVACLKAKKAQLNPACKIVFNAPKPGPSPRRPATVPISTACRSIGAVKIGLNGAETQLNNQASCENQLHRGDAVAN
jgi:hypothetical protein